MPLRTGIVAITFAMRAMLHTLTAYQDKVNAAIDQAVTDGKITAAQAAELKAFLAGLAAAFLIVRMISGY
jgi:polyhydroxyalkanoate synthesis regulator phasin